MHTPKKHSLVSSGAIDHMMLEHMHKLPDEAFLLIFIPQVRNKISMKRFLPIALCH